MYVTPITLENLDELRRLLHPRGVWRNFGYRTPPSLFGLRLAWRGGTGHGVFFHRTDTDRVFGFALGFGEEGPDEEMEFAIAVTSPVERGLRLGTKGGQAAEEHFLGGGRCGVLWAWGDASNSPMLGLARTCGWQLLPDEGETREMVDGVVRIRRVQQTVQGWRDECIRRQNPARVDNGSIKNTNTQGGLS